MRILPTLTACILASGLLHPVVAYAQVIPINQGDQIVAAGSDSDLLCTVGFVDRESHRLWTAGHCAQEGTPVYSSDGRQKLGVLKHRYQIESPTTTEGQEIMDYFFHDIAYVELQPDVPVGTNSFSGDRTHVPERGETICRYGSTTNTAIYCGKILATTDQLIYATDLNTQGGDSGGPTWVPGKGYTGQTLGVFTYQDFPYELTLIHRADLAQVVPQHDDSAGTAHYTPNSVELSRPASVIRVAKRAEVFGKELPTAINFDKYLRNYEITKEKYEQAKRRIISLERILGVYPSWDPGKEARLEKELKAAKAELTRIQAQLEEAVAGQRLAQQEKENLKNYLAQSQKELAESQQQLNDTRQQLADSQRQLGDTKQELADSTQQLANSTLELEKSQQELKDSNEAHEKFKQEAQTQLIITIVVAVLGVLGAIIGGIGAVGKLHVQLPF